MSTISSSHGFMHTHAQFIYTHTQRREDRTGTPGTSTTMLRTLSLTAMYTHVTHKNTHKHKRASSKLPSYTQKSTPPLCTAQATYTAHRRHEKVSHSLVAGVTSTLHSFKLSCSQSRLNDTYFPYGTAPERLDVRPNNR